MEGVEYRRRGGETGNGGEGSPGQEMDFGCESSRSIEKRKRCMYVYLLGLGWVEISLVLRAQILGGGGG